MSRTILQIPIDKSLKEDMAQVASDMGFSSIQEVLRVVMKSMVDKSLTIAPILTQPDEVLTPEQEAILAKKYQQAREEIEAGEGFVSDSVDELMAYLNSDD